jgi:CBS-domain-containing membrane protein
VSIRDQATVKETLLFLTNKGFSAAPVIDEAGHPVGVVSQTNLVIHGRERQVDDTSVRTVMTPAVFSVVPETPASKVVEQMLALQVHRLFVVDQTGVLVGVISAFDVLRHLR